MKWYNTKMMKLQKEVKCIKCEYKWFPRTVKPKKCPNCQSRKWKKNGRYYK